MKPLQDSGTFRARTRGDPLLTDRKLTANSGKAASPPDSTEAPESDAATAGDEF